MITRDEGLKNIDYGLTFLYNADGKYTLMMDNIVKEYPIGGLVCEYARLHPTEIKDVLMSCINLDKEPTAENVTAFICDFNKRLHEKFPPVQAIMICMEFANTFIEWAESQRTGREEEFCATLEVYASNEEVKDFIFNDTPFQDIGRETILQEALSCYVGFAANFGVTMSVFYDVVPDSDNGDEKLRERREKLPEFYGSFIDFQHIDYRIIILENGLNNMYTIRSSISLLLFEVANCLKNDINFSRCPNCNKYFVAEGRSDIIYCSYPSPQNPEKTCREIGAQITRANKEKTDVVTREYRKVYMRLQMITKRHPENREARKKFDRLTAEVKEWRENLKNGTGTVEQYLSWLKEFN